MLYRPLVQDRPRVFGEKLHRGSRPRQHDQVDRQIPPRGRPDGRKEYRDFRHGVVWRYHGASWSFRTKRITCPDSPQNLEQAEIEAVVAEIEAEKEAEAERKRQRLAATQAGQASMAMGSGTATPSGAPGASDAQDMGRESGVQ